MRRSTFVPFGAIWRYRHEEGPVPTGWTRTTFDDSSWPLGPAPLGYNTNERGTRIYPGASFKRRPASAQLRHDFTLDRIDAEAGQSLTLAVHRNTGLRVYLNGEIVAWDGIPSLEMADDVTTGSLTTSDTSRFPLQFSISGRTLRAGRNVLAVDLRHTRREYTALTFDLALASGDAPLDRLEFAAAVSPPIPEPIAVGARAPDFEWLELKTLRRRRLSEQFGEPFLLQFSGAECRPCWKKLPIVRRWADAGLACLSISSWGTVADMAAPAQRHAPLLEGISIGAEPAAYDPHQTACYQKYGIFNGSILVGADGHVLALATGFALDDYLHEVRTIDAILRGRGFEIADVPKNIGVVGGADDWRVVTS
jgi:hypothetical protein